MIFQDAQQGLDTMNSLGIPSSRQALGSSSFECKNQRNEATRPSQWCLHSSRVRQVDDPRQHQNDETKPVFSRDHARIELCQGHSVTSSTQNRRNEASSRQRSRLHPHAVSLAECPLRLRTDETKPDAKMARSEVEWRKSTERTQMPKWQTGDIRNSQNEPTPDFRPGELRVSGRGACEGRPAIPADDQGPRSVFDPGGGRD